jgi:hypothetical protein
VISAASCAVDEFTVGTGKRGKEGGHATSSTFEKKIRTISIDPITISTARTRLMIYIELHANPVFVERKKMWAMRIMCRVVLHTHAHILSQFFQTFHAMSYATIRAMR